MPYDYQVSDTIPAAPRRIYDAWLSSSEHALMTGSQVADITPDLGATFELWDGYISGHTVELVPGRSIVQSWRTTQFTDDEADSQITVTFEGEGSATRVTVLHQNVPDEHKGYENGGWQEHYFEPMKRFFGKPR
jgi:activator of HSP90 ATPase